jgi:peroxiredoxin
VAEMMSDADAKKFWKDMEKLKKQNKCMIPKVIFRMRHNDHLQLAKGSCAIGGVWKDVTTLQLFDHKKIVLFSLPGAFTPTCSSKQLPAYESKYDQLKKFVDDVYCVSVNDAFVMNAWFRDLNIKKVKAIGDGEGTFTAGMGMLVSKPRQGFGLRSWRYSAYIDNGEVKVMFVEPGKNNLSEDNDPFHVSGVETMIKYLNDNNNR